MSDKSPKTPDIPNREIQALLNRHQRQVHLDFHTSPFIPDVAGNFDAEAFARTIAEASVNSVTIFAKCHHGQCYYPTKTGVQHPALNGRDLLGEQIEALHRRDIRCPIYTPVGWEEDAATRFPHWRQMHASGHFAGQTADGSGRPGRWKTLDFTNEAYLDYFEAHLRELLERYGAAVDGVFLDIVFFENRAMYSESATAFRRRHGIVGEDAEAFARFHSRAQAEFTARFTPIIASFQPRATIFYNNENTTFIDGTTGVRSWQDQQTHFEIESLPSGFWGYLHFPRLARHVRTWNKPWLAMTGRFQKMWGDFGGIKPQPALEYECFRAQALGGANSVGDQLPPRGILDPAAYRLIGAVYKQVAEAEPFYDGSEDLSAPVGICLASHPSVEKVDATKSEEGAALMTEELHYDAVFFSDEVRLDPAETPLLILPDTTVITDTLREKIADYYRAGGRLILSYRSGFDARGDFALPFLGLTFHGETAKYPTFWRATEAFWKEASDSDRVIYSRGMNALGAGAEALVHRALPYFNRTDATYMSHFQTPAVEAPDTYPAVIAGDRFVYFADPVFREYRQAGSLSVKEGVKRAIERLIGPAPFGAGLPSTVLVVPRRKGDDLLLTLLHYIPVRKALEIVVIEERQNFAHQILRLPPQVQTVRVWPSGETLAVAGGDSEGAFVLPSDAQGRLLLEAPNFFGAKEVNV